MVKYTTQCPSRAPRDVRQSFLESGTAISFASRFCRALGNPLDPSSDRDSVQTKVIIDATIGPDRRAEYRKVTYDNVDLSEYLAQ